MTNTTSPQIRCGRCSAFQSPVYHSSVAAVRACFQTGYAEASAPKVAVPAAPVALPAPVVAAPQSYQRWSAACPVVGCKVRSVQGAPFDLVCSEHETVTAAKQLVGSLSVKDHKCDSRCINAVGPVCVCGCGGVNHGVGLLVSV